MSCASLRTLSRFAVWTLAIASIAGCHRDMRDQPRYEALEETNFFSDGQSARPLLAGTVARGSLDSSDVFQTAKVKGKFITQIPMQIDRAVLERGQERFNIYCSPCHGRTGAGDGMIVQRGFQRPPSFHTSRLHDASAGHVFDVITHGFGVMPRYSTHVAPSDRWAIVAYVRVLQLSQHATLNDVPPEVRERLEQERP